MPLILTIGILLAGGFLMGEVAQALRLPRVTGYLLAGLALNPQVLPVVPAAFPAHADVAIDIALSFITFSVGGTLQGRKLRQLGKPILWMTVLEAECAMLVVTVGFALAALVFGFPHLAAVAAAPLALALLLGVLAAPTDPSATLAVVHQYHAAGPVTDTVMGIAASDDVLGIVNFSLGVALARMATVHAGFAFGPSVFAPLFSIGGGIGLGALCGAVFNRFSTWFRRETEGQLIVLVFALLCLCYGAARAIHVDELLATMAMGCVVANFHPRQEQIFGLLQRYQEELIFVFFFVLSGMKLNLAVLPAAAASIAVFVGLRALGKTLGAHLGARIAGAPPPVRRYAFLGLLPQGGIVIGLALIIHTTPAFRPVADLIMGIAIGATVIHEIAGPLVARLGLQKAGEIPPANG